MHSITSDTRVFAVLGDPVSQSRSPIIHNAAFHAAKVDAVYTTLRCNAADCASLILALSRAGGGGNVTIPHKGVAARTVEKPSPAVKATQACNTFWLEKNKVHGDNTDVAGFTHAVHELMPDLKGTRALVVGAGGGARALVYAVLEEGADWVTVLGRSRARRDEIEHVAGRRLKRVAYITSDKSLRHEGFDLIINTTPLGHRPNDALPFSLSKVAGVRAVFDIVYKMGGTKWVGFARALGIPASDGKEMLIQQAAAAFECWFQMQAPIATMRRAFDR
jgi:shikimate dehydrogenase